MHRGLTLEALAARVDSTPATLSRIERRLQPYSQPLVEALAAALGCEPPDLTRAESPSQPEIEMLATMRRLPRDQQQKVVNALKALVA